MSIDVCELAMEKVNKNLSPEELIAKAIEREEGVVAGNGAFSVVTGNRSGRSTKDRFIVNDDITETAIEWGSVNRPIEKEKFDALWDRATNYLAEKETFVSELQIGANEKYALPVRVITEFAWHQLFCHNMFVRDHSVDAPENLWVLMSAPSLHTDPDRDDVNSDATLIIDFTQRRVLLCGLRYAGEMKKAMFSAMNFLLPERNVLPMHCASNVGEGGDVALFFGLSGTGKTTLSADEGRFLIGDDEHGWSRDGVFNFEGGCYAKCINLSAEKEPVIYHAIREGAVMENVVLDAETKMPNYADDQYSQNSRVAYPREHLQHFVLENRGNVPKVVIFLTCDLYGVLPPVAKLTREQAAYHFLSGYTALVGSTEVGQQGIKSTFSTCFGAPFFPRPAQVYAELLLKRLEESGASVYLVNTGWTGGAYAEGGKRFDIPVTRSIVRAILRGDLEEAEHEVLPGFDLAIPKSLTGVDSQLLNPKETWPDEEAYNKSLHTLMEKFTENFQKFKVAPEIINAGPQIED